MTQNEPAPTSRIYLHDRCEQPTVVSDDAFSALASPLAGVQQTYCNACKSMFAVDEFRWADTDEKLTDYYLRHASRASAIDRFIASRHSVITALVLAVLLGILTVILCLVVQGEELLTSIFLGIGVGVLSLLTMGAILIFVLTPIVHRRVCKVSDPRRLI